MNIENITTADLLAEIARRIGNQPESTPVKWRIVNGYTIKPAADLRGADLYRADLRGEDLREADLREADLREADLREADLYGADLSGADLGGARMHFTTNLNGALVNGDTTINLSAALVNDAGEPNGLPDLWKIEAGRIVALEGMNGSE